MKQTAERHQERLSERHSDRHSDHYCWVKIVGPAAMPADGIADPPDAPRIPATLRRAFDSAQLLKKMADGDSPPPGGQRPPPVPASPPPVSPNSPPPPPPPGIHRAEAASARRRPPQWRVERGSTLASTLGMEVAGVSGDRTAAWQWIESEDGRRWREGAVGLDLVLFTGTLDD